MRVACFFFYLSLIPISLMIVGVWQLFLVCCIGGADLPLGHQYNWSCLSYNTEEQPCNAGKGNPASAGPRSAIVYWLINFLGSLLLLCKHKSKSIFMAVISCQINCRNTLQFLAEVVISEPVIFLDIRRIVI